MRILSWNIVGLHKTLQVCSYDRGLVVERYSDPSLVPSVRVPSCRHVSLNVCQMEHVQVLS